MLGTRACESLPCEIAHKTAEARHNIKACLVQSNNSVQEA
jgi:hypothetical protein